MSGFDALAQRLTARAAALAEAHALSHAAAAPARWRNPRLLWPLFTKGVE